MIYKGLKTLRGLTQMKILAIGPHPDDIELGCFGTLSKLKEENHEIHMLILTNGEKSGNPEERKEECKVSAAIIDARLHFGGLSDTQINEGTETIHVIENILSKINPQIVFAPSNEDTHQDHRNTSKASISAARKVPELYFYETPSTTRNFSPNIFFDITETFINKLEALRIHQSQEGKSYMTRQAIEGLANFRGFDVGLIGKKIEAFEVFKIIRK